MVSTFLGKYTEFELRSAMAHAVTEASALGRAGLRRKYGFGSATKFVAVAAGNHFDSNALVAAAAAHLSPPIVLTPSDFLGGVATTRFLDACEIPWIDTKDLENVPGLHIAANPALSDAERPKYWWVNQSANYSTVIEEGTLWAPHLRADGKPGHKDWQALQYMRPGDVVFHYAAQKFQAISRVVSAGVDSPRPIGYPPEDYPTGTLILVEPVMRDMEVGIQTLKRVFRPGIGPMNKSESVGRIYVAPVAASIGQPLLQYLSGRRPADGPSSSVPPEESVSDWTMVSDAMDIIGVARVRAEQRYLRSELLARYGTRCALCGRALPAQFLVAAHIKRRSDSSDAERLDFKAAAMLACTLGCDALFEYGYVTVDAAGIVCSGSTDSSELSEVLQNLDGAQCLAFSDATAKNFEFHRQLGLRGQLGKD